MTSTATLLFVKLGVDIDAEPQTVFDVARLAQAGDRDGIIARLDGVAAYGDVDAVADRLIEASAMRRMHDEETELVDAVYFIATGRFLDHEFAPESLESARAAMESAGIASASFGHAWVGITLTCGASAAAWGSRAGSGMVPSIFWAAYRRAKDISDFRAGCDAAARRIASDYDYPGRYTDRDYKAAMRRVRYLDWVDAGRPDHWSDADELAAME